MSAQKKPTFERHVNTVICKEIMEHSKPGELIQWKTFENACGQELGVIRGYINRARHICERDYQICFETCRQQGLKRLTQAKDIVSSTDSHRIRIGSVSRKAKMRLNCISFENLTIPERLEAVSRNAVFHVIDSATKASAMKKIKNIAINYSQERAIPFGHILKALGVVDTAENAKGSDDK